jgi:hypothetical protein
MYTLILIVTFIANGAAVDIDHIPFNSKSDCQEALIEILRDNQEPNGSLTVKGYCVAKG